MPTEPVRRARIRHRTSYAYSELVLLNPHRLLLRPRETCATRLLSFELTVEPEARISWGEDVFGNAVATMAFTGATDRLVIESRAELELASPAWPVFDIAASALSYPFLYAAEEWIDLGALAAPGYPDPEGRLARWARAFVAGDPTDTLSLLKDLSNGVSAWISYQSREMEGTQSPVQTLDRGWGSCRDFAVLFVEAARSLGFGARLISGYLHDPDGGLIGSIDEGSTHAWAEVYLPGAGWISFDPTNRSVGSFNLIPVAIARVIDQATPISGSFAGSAATTEMKVEVEIA